MGAYWDLENVSVGSEFGRSNLSAGSEFRYCPGNQPFCFHFSESRCFLLFLASVAFLHLLSLAAVAVPANRIITMVPECGTIKVSHSASVVFATPFHYNVDECRHLVGSFLHFVALLERFNILIFSAY